ncbi:MAG: membrane-bound lytic murein transglycosylase MltF [Desulfobacterales bacterium]|nr:membrane-bound lytic murein transglycosylase MltF [Desulfobacterales bacterium]
MQQMAQTSRKRDPLNLFFRLLLVAGFILICGLYVFLFTPEPPPEPALDRILRTGKITVLTRNNANCYYLYRSQPMGFEYDLAKAFADHLGVRLEIKVAQKWEGMIPDIQTGEADMIAADLTITAKRLRQVAFSDGYLTTRQQIITNRYHPKIRSPIDLAGQTVHVRRGTSYQERLEEMQQAGIDVTIRLHVDMPTEELIRQVAEGDIGITIADEHIAQLNRRYYPGARIVSPLSENQSIGWAVHKKAGKLRRRINHFLKTIATSGKYAEIYDRYFSNLDMFDYVDVRSYHRRLRTRLPSYRTIIEAAAKLNNFDWRLVAAQMYQESHFNPAARSHAGAFGLMQLTISTARSLGVTAILDPHQNIQAGVLHLKRLYDFFNAAPEPDRLSIALAAYNVGQGHLWDARDLARQFNLDPNRWASLEKTLPLLRYRKYYSKSRYGYCRGTEPINYIRQIFFYYDILKRHGIEYPRIHDPAGNGKALKG